MGVRSAYFNLALARILCRMRVRSAFDKVGEGLWRQSDTV